MYQVSGPEEPAVAENRLPSLPRVESVESEEVVVGRIAAMEDCRGPIRTMPRSASTDCVGTRYDLTSGLMEIAYDSGARVILQGPCTYKVDSGTGGYLAVGILTARVEKKGEGERGRGREERWAIGPTQIIGKSPYHLSSFPSPPSLFPLIRGSHAHGHRCRPRHRVWRGGRPVGRSQTHVYRGKVEMRAIDGKAGDAGNGERGLAGRERVGSGGDWQGQGCQGGSRIGRAGPVCAADAQAGADRGFWHGGELEAWATRIRTGRSRPRATTPTQAAAGGGDRARRIRVGCRIGSTVANGCRGEEATRCLCPLATYTFRTKFDLDGMRASTAVLRGRFAADDHVREIRLNGREIPLPPHGEQEFSFLRPFSSDGGFVEGVNVLEIDVENWDPLVTPSSSTMGLIVELEGSALTAWPDHSPGDAGTKQEKPGNRETVGAAVVLPQP